MSKFSAVSRSCIFLHRCIALDDFNMTGRDMLSACINVCAKSVAEPEDPTSEMARLLRGPFAKPGPIAARAPLSASMRETCNGRRPRRMKAPAGIRFPLNGFVACISFWCDVPRARG